jgi:hypothetical protein
VPRPSELDFSFAGQAKPSEGAVGRHPWQTESLSGVFDHHVALVHGQLSNSLPLFEVEGREVSENRGASGLRGEAFKQSPCTSPRERAISDPAICG